MKAGMPRCLMVAPLTAWMEKPSCQLAGSWIRRTKDFVMVSRSCSSALSQEEGARRPSACRADAERAAGSVHFGPPHPLAVQARFQI